MMPSETAGSAPHEEVPQLTGHGLRPGALPPDELIDRANPDVSCTIAAQFLLRD